MLISLIFLNGNINVYLAIFNEVFSLRIRRPVVSGIGVQIPLGTAGGVREAVPEISLAYTNCACWVELRYLPVESLQTWLATYT